MFGPMTPTVSSHQTLHSMCTRNDLSESTIKVPSYRYLHWLSCTIYWMLSSNLMLYAQDIMNTISCKPIEHKPIAQSVEWIDTASLSNNADIFIINRQWIYRELTSWLTIGYVWSRLISLDFCANKSIVTLRILLQMKKFFLELMPKLLHFKKQKNGTYMVVNDPSHKLKCLCNCDIKQDRFDDEQKPPEQPHYLKGMPRKWNSDVSTPGSKYLK